MSNAVLCVEGLSKSFGDKKVLNNIHFNLNSHDSFVVLGGSGTGKSVLVKCILGLIPFDKGKITIHGKDTSTLSRIEKQELYLSIGVLFQGGALFDSLSVAQNVTFALTHVKGMSFKKAKDIAMEKLNAVDLPENTADLFPSELSGGMQKRVALARAIAMDPAIIFFDEPTTGLDPIVSHTINTLIAKITQKSCALTITHDLKSMRAIGRHVGLLDQGDFVWQGGVEEIDQTQNEKVLEFINA
jgi:phospholipid/cholesterol/gamma-HCH transport system ATP-binding protein